MIAVKSLGRMGNQMFQFAFAYSKAKRYNTTPFIDKWSSLKYFELHDRYKYVNLLNKAKFTRLIWSNRFMIKNLMNQDYNENILDVPYFGFLHLGFYQSSIYFQDLKPEIMTLFKVKEKFRSEPASTPYAAIHMRFGDYKELNNSLLGKDISLPAEYYQSAAEKFLQRYECIVIVSDDLALAKTYLAPNDKFKFQSDSEINDFQTLMHADALCISNSTYSWWAAYLNENAKEIFAPKYWMGINISETYPKEIFYDLNWTYCDIQKRN